VVVSFLLVLTLLILQVTTVTILINVILQVKVGEVGGNTLGLGAMVTSGSFILTSSYLTIRPVMECSLVTMVTSGSFILTSSKNKTTTWYHGYQGAFHHWSYSKVKTKFDIYVFIEQKNLPQYL
jgi:hypothetical protein